MAIHQSTWYCTITVYCSCILPTYTIASIRPLECLDNEWLGMPRPTPVRYSTHMNQYHCLCNESTVCYLLCGQKGCVITSVDLVIYDQNRVKVNSTCIYTEDHHLCMLWVLVTMPTSHREQLHNHMWMKVTSTDSYKMRQYTVKTLGLL